MFRFTPLELHWLAYLVAAFVLVTGGWWAHVGAERWRHRQCDYQDGYDKCESEMQGELDDLADQLDEARDARDLWRRRAEDMRDRSEAAAAAAVAAAESPTLVHTAMHPPRRHDTGTHPRVRANLAHLARERFDEDAEPDLEGEQRTPSAPRRAEMLSELAPDALDAENGQFGDAHEREPQEIRVPMEEVAPGVYAGSFDVPLVAGQHHLVPDLPTSPRPADAAAAEPQIAAVGDASYISTDEFDQARAAVIAAHGEMPAPLQAVIDAGGRFAMPPRKPRAAPRKKAAKPEPPQPRLVRSDVAATGQIPVITDAQTFAEPAWVSDIMGERGASESTWFRERMAQFAPEHRLAIER